MLLASLKHSTKTATLSFQQSKALCISSMKVQKTKHSDVKYYGMAAMCIVITIAMIFDLVSNSTLTIKNIEIPFIPSLLLVVLFIAISIAFMVDIAKSMYGSKNKA